MNRSEIGKGRKGAAWCLTVLSTIALTGALSGCGSRTAEADAPRNLSVVTDNSVQPAGAVLHTTSGDGTDDTPSDLTADPTAAASPSASPTATDPGYIAPKPAPVHGTNDTGLPEPFLDKILPAGIPQVTPDKATIGQIATPKKDYTVAFGAIGSRPMLALSSVTDELLGMDAQWAVMGQRDGWVQVLVPVGRGALPSQDPELVNHHAVWVLSKDVTLAPAQYEIDVNTDDYTLTLKGGPDGDVTFHVGVGVKGKTDTPKGLCYVVGHVMIQSGEPGLLTNCQSERVDGYGGADDAATAIHVATGFDPETGGSVSNGCVRVTAKDFADYLSNIPAGTPVVISGS